MEKQRREEGKREKEGCLREKRKGKQNSEKGKIRNEGKKTAAKRGKVK